MLKLIMCALKIQTRIDYKLNIIRTQAALSKSTSSLSKVTRPFDKFTNGMEDLKDLHRKTMLKSSGCCSHALKADNGSTSLGFPLNTLTTP